MGVSAFCFLVLVFFIADYFTMNLTRAKYKELLKQTAVQAQLLGDYEDSIRRLRQTIKDYESYTKKLSVMAGLKSPQVTEEMGIGGEPTGGMDNQAAPPVNYRNFVFCCAGRTIVQAPILPHPIVGDDRSGRRRLSKFNKKLG